MLSLSLSTLSGIHDGLAAVAIRAEVQLGIVFGAFNTQGPITANCTDTFVTTLSSGITMVIRILMGLGVAIAVIGIIVGGLMRATAWGSEQRIAMSNKAITCAVLGLIIVLLGVTLGSQIPKWFGSTGCILHG